MFVLEARGINVSEVLKIIMAQIYLWLNNPKKAKKTMAAPRKTPEIPYSPSVPVLAGMYGV